MIDFELTEEQKLLQDMAHKFAEKEIVPVVCELDQTGRFPIEIVKKSIETGLINLNVPEAYGGPGVGILEECIVAEELAWACSGVATSLLLNSLSAWPIVLAGNDEQKKHYLGRMMQKQELAAYCLTEPSAGSDVIGIQTTARRDGDQYVLNGTKQFITNGTYANFYVVFAYTDREKRHKGMSAFVVDRELRGVSAGKKEVKLGQIASDTCSMIFEDVRVPRKSLLGAEGDGFHIAMQVFDRSRPAIASMAVGVARRAMEHSIDYARQRQAFGKPLFQQQAISFMIAEMAMNIEAARLLCWRSARMTESGHGRASKYAAYAKAFAADMCQKCTTDAVQIFGGYGYSREYPVEKLMRDCKVFQIYEGTSQIQRVIIAREIFRD